MVVQSRRQTFRPGELPLVLLALISDGPLTAYEVIGELERLFGPDYRPSPGGVYPAIAALTAEKLLHAQRDGRALRYSITPAGRAALDARRRQLAAIEARTGARVRDGAAIAPLLDRFNERIFAVVGRVDPAAIERTLETAATRIERLAAKQREGDSDGTN